MKKILNLDNVTIVSVAGVRALDSLKAIKYSMRDIKFKNSKLFTPEFIQSSDVEIIKTDEMDYEHYNKFIVYELYKYIETEYALIVQDDGFVVHPESWDNNFLNYDYIGAPWMLPQDNFSYRDSFGNIIRVGNGGFSLRSKKLLELASKLNIPWKAHYGFYNEDGFITCHNRHIYEKEGCRFAPLEVARHFSHEARIPEIENIIPFGFHGKYYLYTRLLNTINLC